MDIITVNVGQGALALVRNEGEALAIDAKMPPGSDETVVNVKRYLATFLNSYRLRGVVLTGFDKDHTDVRCLAILLRKYRPDWVLIPDYSKNTNCYAEAIDLIDSEVIARQATSSPLRKVAVTTISAGRIAFDQLTNAFDLEVLSPHPEDMTCSNNCSLVIRVTGRSSGGFSYLVTGDIENSGWERINRTYGSRLRSDVMAAPHHGARDATNAQTLLLVSPNTVLISAGVDNPYGHPDPAVLGAYARVATHVFGTYVDGGCSLHTQKGVGDYRTIAFTG